MKLELQCEDIKEKVLADIGRNEKGLESDVASLRQWISHQHHFPQADISDVLLKSFVIGCKGSLEIVKSKLDAYFTSRGKFPDIFSNRDPSEPAFIRNATSQPIVTLPGRTQEGCRVHVTWLEENGSHYDVTGWTRRIVAQWEILLRTDPYTSGEIFLISGTHFTFSHAYSLTPTHVTTLFSLAQKVFPLRIKGIWFFNAPPACDFIVNKIIKPIISKKLSDRIVVHSGDHKVLNKHFSSKLLPEDYGGELPQLKQINDMWLERVARYRDWFVGEGSFTTVETKRPAESNDAFTGSFRKLQVD